MCSPVATSRRSRVGVTLIELLIVTGIMAVVGVAISAAVAGGIRVWDAARTFNTVDTDALFALGILERDLVNTFPFYDVSFEGSAQRVSFPGLSLDDEGRERVATVEHVFDPSRGRLLRRTHVYPAPDLSPAAGEELLRGAVGVTLRYFRPAESGTGGEWVGAWSSATSHPSRVSIELRFDEGEDAIAVKRVVLLPLG